MFWDSSALVPAVLDEEKPEMREMLGLEKDPVMWWGTPVECSSALYRRHREKTISLQQRDEAAGMLQDIVQGFRIIPASDSVRSLAVWLLARHSLRAGDALQLAAALVWCEGRAEERDFVCLDKRLRESAGREGFRVLPK